MSGSHYKYKNAGKLRGQLFPRNSCFYLHHHSPSKLCSSITSILLSIGILTVIVRTDKFYSDPEETCFLAVNTLTLGTYNYCFIKAGKLQ